MSDINSKISLTDGVTPVMNSMLRTMNSMHRAMELMDAATNNAFSGDSIGEINKALNSVKANFSHSKRVLADFSSQSNFGELKSDLTRVDKKVKDVEKSAKSGKDSLEKMAGSSSFNSSGVGGLGSSLAEIEASAVKGSKALDDFSNKSDFGTLRSGLTEVNSAVETVEKSAKSSKSSLEKMASVGTFNSSGVGGLGSSLAEIEASAVKGGKALDDFSNKSDFGTLRSGLTEVNSAVETVEKSAKGSKSSLEKMMRSSTFNSSGVGGLGSSLAEIEASAVKGGKALDDFSNKSDFGTLRSGLTEVNSAVETVEKSAKGSKSSLEKMMRSSAFNSSGIKNLNSSLAEVEAGAVKGSKALADFSNKSDFSSMKNNLRQVNNEIETVEKSASRGSISIMKMATSFGLVKVASKVLRSIGNSLSGSFGRIDTLDNFGRSLNRTTGRAEVTNAVLANTKDIVVGTGYGLDSASQSVQRFVNSSMGIKNSVDYTRDWADAIAQYGDGADDTFSRVMYQMGQMASKGKANLGDLNSAMEAGIPVLQIYAKAANKSTQEVSKAISDGKISAQGFMDTMGRAFRDGVDGFSSVAGAAKDAGSTWTNTFSNMRAAITRGVAEIIGATDQGFGSAGLGSAKKVIAEIGATFENVLGKIAAGIKYVFQIIGAVIGFVRGHLTAFKVLLIIIAAIVTTMLIGNMWNFALTAVKSFFIAGEAGKTAGYKVMLAWIKANWPMVLMIAIIGILIVFWKDLGTVAKAVLMWIAAGLFIVQLAAMGVTWPFLIFIFILSIVILAFVFFRDQAVDAFGRIAGGAFWLGQFILNIFKGIANFYIVFWEWVINVVISACEKIVNAWNMIGYAWDIVWYNIKQIALKVASAVVGKVQDIVNSVLGGISDMINAAIGGLNKLIGLANKIKGVNISTIGEVDLKPKGDWTKKIEDVKDTMEKPGKKPEQVAYDRVSFNRFEYGSLGDAYDKGYNIGEKAGNWVGDKIDGLTDKLKGMTGSGNQGATNNAVGLDDLTGLDDPSDLVGGANNKGNPNKGLNVDGGKLDEVGKINSDISLSDEDVKYLKDIAKTEYVNKYTTLKPTSYVTFGDVKETADVEKIKAAIEDMIANSYARAYV